MLNQLKISVRSLVEYVFRSGSVETGFRTYTALTEGTKAHQKIQQTYGDGDLKEVPLEAAIILEGLTYSIDGRCDGILFSEEGATIDEIKSTSGDLASINEETHPVHWAQAIFYAYMYASKNSINEMNVQLTYIQVRTDERKSFKKHFSLQELEAFVRDVIKRFSPYAVLRLKLENDRNKSIKELPFPFNTYREGQRKLAGAVYTSIREGQDLFAQAPTGIGKTMSTLFPSVKAIGEGLVQRIFYITAKTITRTAAEEALALMQKKALSLKTVTITAKEKVCLKEQTICSSAYCEFANGYYDRINDAVIDILSNETLISRTVIERYSIKHRVCPFEFSLDLAFVADLVICDYNYVFDPRVSLKRFFEEHKKQSVLLVDEAHNLVDRARTMYSSEMIKSDYLQLKRLFKGSNQLLFDRTSDINNYFIQLRKSTEQKQFVLRELQKELVELLTSFSEAAEELLIGLGDEEDTELLLEVYFKTQSFLRIAKLYDERFVTLVEIERNDVRLKLLCIDPSYLLMQMGKGYRSKVYFSATFSPLSYFKDMLGADDEAYDVTIASPFKQEQLDVFIKPLSTRFRDRERSRGPIADLIHNTVKKTPGNYLVFFPSYQYLNDVYRVFEYDYPNVNVIVQENEMTEEARENFLKAFSSENMETLVGFAVMGGIFSEGIDLQGDRLNGVIVIGVGLPQFNFERDIIKDYFNETGKNGFNYAYVFPGMNKVLQAGGRLIRSEEDTGTIILVDDRFLQQPYLSLLPPEWQHFNRLTGSF